MSNRVQAINAALMVNVSGTYYLVGCETDFSYEYINENILRTDVNANGYRQRRVRISDVGSSCSGVVTTSNDADSVSIFYLQQDAIRRSVIQLKFVWEDEDGLVKELTGNFIIKNINISNPVGDFSKFDISFDGAGDGIIIDDEIPPNPGSDEGIDSDYWTTTESATGISGTSANGKSFAGKTVFLVSREGAPYFPVSTLVESTDYVFDGTNINFLIPFNPGERVFVAWHD